MMILEMTKNDFLLTTAGVALALGVLMWLIGVTLLVSRVLGGDVKRIAEQTTRLAQKGIAEEIAGLVGNASTLIESLNQMIRTTAGIGAFLVIAGMLMVAAAFGLALQIQ
ncbi:MAG: hypothetical protein AB1453_06570 [Chloroflexota bacterium]|jgi:Na+-transporting methylmalonyl-CoA/oxaloacetate decarboxylase gamma subunit